MQYFKKGGGGEPKTRLYCSNLSKDCGDSRRLCINPVPSCQALFIMLRSCHRVLVTAGPPGYPGRASCISVGTVPLPHPLKTQADARTCSLRHARWSVVKLACASLNVWSVLMTWGQEISPPSLQLSLSVTSVQQRDGHLAPGFPVPREAAAKSKAAGQRGRLKWRAREEIGQQSSVQQCPRFKTAIFVPLDKLLKTFQ